MGSTYGLVGPDGWRIDPWHSHEFRYYSTGVATAWVSSSGFVSEEFAVSVDELLDEFAAMQFRARVGAAPATGMPARPAYRAGTTSQGPFATPYQAPQYLAPPYRAPQYLAPPYEAPACLPPPQRPLEAPCPEPEGWSSPDGSGQAAPVDPSAVADPMQTVGPVPRPKVPSAAVVATAVVALVLVGSLASFAATHGGQPVRFSGASTTVTSTTPSPASAAAPPSALSAASRLQAWWTTAGQPDTQTLAADIALLGGRTAGSGTLSGDCRIFATDAAAAGAAPTPPSTTIEREWQQTLSTVNRIASACAASRYSQMTADLQPASYTIADLTAQVAGHLGGA